MPRGDPNPRAPLPAIPTPANPFPIDQFLTLKQIYVRPDNKWYVFASRPFDTEWYLIGEDLLIRTRWWCSRMARPARPTARPPAGFSVDELTPLPCGRMTICTGCREYVFPKHAEVCEDPPRYGDHRGGDPY